MTFGTEALWDYVADKSTSWYLQIPHKKPQKVVILSGWVSLHQSLLS